MRILKIVLIIFFSICFAGCISFKPNADWQLPEKPKGKSVYFKVSDDGFFLSKLDAKILADNIDELRAYVKKLEVLIETMERHYE